MPTATPLASVGYANSYFANRLHSSAWFDSTEDDQAIGLLQSTRAINQLNYKGRKTILDQENEFPRIGLSCSSSTVPDEIMQACCENAIRLLDGFDMELERQGLNVTHRGYAQVKTTYDPNFVPPYIGAGIASALAWHLLLPFLNERSLIAIRRI